MEFKFRAIEEQAPTNIPLPSRISYFTEQALRAGYAAPELGHAAEFFRSPSNVREAIKWELEKERIREEIIAAEIARRLEEEARRDMLLEGEMALRRSERFSAFSGSASAMRLEPRLPLLHKSEGRSLEERLALSLEERLGYHARGGVGAYVAFSAQGRSPRT